MFKLGLKVIIAAAILAAASLSSTAQPSARVFFGDGWTFTKDGNSKVVDLPHDWGVDGPFNINYPGETGKLEWWGKAEYTKTLTVPANATSSPAAERYSLISALISSIVFMLRAPA